MFFHSYLKILLLLSVALMLQACGGSAQEENSVKETSGEQIREVRDLAVWLKQVEKIWIEPSGAHSQKELSPKYQELYAKGNLVAGLYVEKTSSGEQKKTWEKINADNGVVDLVRRAADEGDAIAQAVMGDIHWYSLAKFARNFSESSKWYLKSANQNNVSGMAFLANTFLQMQKYEDAAQWYGKAAERGHTAAQNSLGYLYFVGKGVKRDYGEAEEWYRKAAEQGYADAQYNLGSLYYMVKQDKGEAINWYRKAAEQGQVDAQNSLGVMYAKGIGVEQDYDEAANWFRKAAEQGHAEAQKNLLTISTRSFSSQSSSGQ